MGIFSFNGAHVTIGPVTGGFAQGYDGTNNRLKLSGSLGVGISLNAFSVNINCDCDKFQPGDHITVRTTTLLFATKVRIHYRLCGGACNGSKSYWTGGLGLGISGTLKYKFDG
jgi:hypothetical protein